MSVISDVKKLNARITNLEEELNDTRRVLAVLLEQSSLETAEKKRLAALIAVELEEIEVKAEVIHYEKTIQQLLDE